MSRRLYRRNVSTRRLKDAMTTLWTQMIWNKAEKANRMISQLLNREVPEQTAAMVSHVGALIMVIPGNPLWISRPK
jgi:hypothetical protein